MMNAMTTRKKNWCAHGNRRVREIPLRSLFMTWLDFYFQELMRVAVDRLMSSDSRAKRRDGLVRLGDIATSKVKEGSCIANTSST